MIRIQENVYEIIEEHKDGFNLEAFKERYSDILDKFDYISGDWGYGQLRLKGFFEDANKKSSFDSKISFFDEYILEYCNFGCAYFLVKKRKDLSGLPIEEEEGTTAEATDESSTGEAVEGQEIKDKRRENRRRPPRANKRKFKDNREREVTKQPLA